MTTKAEEPKYKKDKQLNEKVSLFRGDITKLEVDAIVNAGEWGLLAGRSQRPGWLPRHLCSSLLCQAWVDATWLWRGSGGRMRMACWRHGSPVCWLRDSFPLKP